MVLTEMFGCAPSSNVSGREWLLIDDDDEDDDDDNDDDDDDGDDKD